jgi:hypothetical protein
MLALIPSLGRTADTITTPDLNLTGQPSEVYTVAFSPDGRRLASASNRVVIVWDLSVGKQLFNSPTKGINVFGLAFSPDGKQLAVGVSQVLKLLDATTGKEEKLIGGAGNFLSRLAFSPDGKHLTAGGMGKSSGNALHVWDAVTHKQVLRLGSPAGDWLNVAYSPDGRRLATAGGAARGNRPGEVTVWEADGGREVVTLRGHTDNVYGVSFSPDGRRVASASGRRGRPRPGEVKLWEVLTGQEALRLDGHTGPVFAVAFSPGGHLLATASGDRTVRLWEATTGREVLCLPGHTGIVYSVAFSPDGKRLASAGQDRAVKVWKVPALDRAARKPLGEEQAQACWEALRGDDARKAYRAVVRLAAAPKEAVPFLRARVRPAAPLPREGQQLLDRWLRDLDDDRFEVRERASAALVRLGEAALPAARKTLAESPSAEVRRRLQDVVERLARLALSPQGRAALRGVEALEYAGTAEARGLLKELAAGLPETRLTREAEAALARLARGGASP